MAKSVITLAHLHNITLPIKPHFSFQAPQSDGIVKMGGTVFNNSSFRTS